jgi:hypothetical protein
LSIRVVVAVLLSVPLGVGCFVLATTMGRAVGEGAFWFTWLVTMCASTFALAWLSPKAWVATAALLVVAQPVCVRLSVSSEEIARPTRSTGGMAGVCIGSSLMLCSAPLFLFTGWMGARIGRGMRRSASEQQERTLSQD